MDEQVDAGPEGGDVVDGPVDSVVDLTEDVADLGPPAPPFATIVRIVNVGPTAVVLYPVLSPTCLYGYRISGAETTELPDSSIEYPDTICDCATCGRGPGGGPRCEAIDFICNDPPRTLPPGGTFDFAWDGTILRWFAPDAGADCPIRCSRFTPVPAGRYVFSVNQPTMTWTATVSLPVPGGVIEIPVTAPG